MLIALLAAVQAMAPIDIKRTEIAPGVHQFTVAADGYVEQLNSVAIIGDDGVLVFDTTTRPSTARTILAEIRKLTPKPVTMVVNSHWHPDHWSGNEVFAAGNPALQIVATEKERDFMLNLSALWGSYLPNALADQEAQASERLAGDKDDAATKAQIRLELQQVRDLVAEQLKVKRTYPNITYSDRLTIRRGGREMHLISVAGDAASAAGALIRGHWQRPKEIAYRAPSI